MGAVLIKTMKYLILLTILITSLCSASGQSVTEVAQYSENIYSPTNIYIVGEDSLLIVDLNNKEAVVTLHDLNQKKVIASRRAGRGPGEFAQNGVKYITTYNNNLLWIWDEGQMKAIILNKSLDYVGDIISDNKSVSSALLKNKNLVVVKNFFSTEYIVGLYELKGKRIQSNPLKKLSTQHFPSYAPITNNPLINQGPMTRADDAVYIGFNYASNIIVIDKNNAIDTLKNHPEYIPFPEYKSKNGYEAPDQAKFPLATLDIATDDNNIYILFSGKTFDMGFLNKVKNAITGEIADKIEKSSNATDVFVFDKRTKKYKNRFTLPHLAKSITVSGGYMYGLSYVDGIYFIKKYKMDL